MLHVQEAEERKKCAAEEERSLIQLCDEFSAFSTVYANAIVFRFCIILFRVSSMARHRGFFFCWSSVVYGDGWGSI